VDERWDEAIVSCCAEEFMSTGELFTREEAVGGLPAKRARALLFLIERRSAYLAARDQEIAALMAAPMMEVPAPVVAAQLLVDKGLSDASGERSDTAGAPSSDDDSFLRAFGQSRYRLRPNIRQIERYAREWASLVPDNPRLRAAVARLLGEKYRFTQRATPGIQRALGLDQPAVQQAYERQYGEPLEAIYAPTVSASERLRWLLVAFGKWLDALPPFWFAFAFTLTETVGAAILALPIAMSEVGPLPAVAILIVIGLINLLTVVCVAEAVSRSGVIRSRQAFFGRLVADYLGSAGSLLFTVLLAMLAFLLLLVYSIGLSTALAGATGVPPAVWTAALFAISLYFVSRRTLNSTVVSALLVGAVNIGLILALSALALAHARWEHLAYVHLSLISGGALDSHVLSLVFGVVMCAYFGHIAIGNCAGLVLQRDPRGRALIRGCAAAQVAAVILYCLFVVAVSGALGSHPLARHSGTALEPLARVIGPGVWTLGLIYVVLGLGMAAIHFAFGLHNLIDERLPLRPRVAATLYQGAQRLVLEERATGSGPSASDGPRIGLTYLGLDGNRPRLCMDVQVGGELHTVETVIDERWEIGELFDPIPALRGYRLNLELQCAQANEESVRLIVRSTLQVRDEVGDDTAGMLRLFDLPDAFWPMASWILRRGGATVTEAAAHFGQDAGTVRGALDTLVSQGVLRRLIGGTEPRYQARSARRRGRVLPNRIWTALEGPASEAPSGSAASRELGAKRRPGWLREALLGDRGRLLLSTSPLMVAFLSTEWLFFRGAQSFTGLINFLGVILISMLGGVFPVLLLAASRCKGECVPGSAWRALGSRPVLAAIYLTYLGALLLHGLVIWKSPLARAAALATATLTVAATVVMARRGAFSPRMVVELCEDLREGQPSLFSVMAAGQPLAAAVRLDYGDDERQHDAASGTVDAFSTLQSAIFHLPGTDARELKVWTRRVTPDGESEVLPALVELRCGTETQRVDMGLCRGQALFSIPGDACRVQITLSR
jgi:Tryptophan/tyrosine permease family